MEQIALCILAAIAAILFLPATLVAIVLFGITREAYLDTRAVVRAYHRNNGPKEGLPKLALPILRVFRDRWIEQKKAAFGGYKVWLACREDR